MGDGFLQNDPAVDSKSTLEYRSLALFELWLNSHELAFLDTRRNPAKPDLAVDILVMSRRHHGIETLRSRVSGIFH
jgi:hypothetical protein